MESIFVVLRFLVLFFLPSWTDAANSILPENTFARDSLNDGIDDGECVVPRVSLIVLGFVISFAV